MEEKRFTLETVMAWGPCYEREKIAEWFAGRDSLTVADCLALSISDEDKLWCLLHPEVIPEAQIHKLARARAAAREAWVAAAAAREAAEARGETWAAAEAWAEAARAEVWAAAREEIALQLDAAIKAAQDN